MTRPARTRQRPAAERSESPPGSLVGLIEHLEAQLEQGRGDQPGGAANPASTLPDSERFVDTASQLIDSLPLLERAYTRSRRSSQRDRGAFVTPADLAAQMVDRVVAGVTLANCVILDPACGAGQLLVAAARRLLAANPTLTVDDQIALVREHIRGVELDPTLARAARLALRLLWRDTDADTTSLQDCVAVQDALQLERQALASPATTLLILANPPFVGVTENGFHTPAGRTQHYRVLATANQAAHFWDRIDSWCSRPGDRYTVLLPRNLLVGDATAPLRRAVDTDLREVMLMHNSRLFADATVSVVVLTVERAPFEPEPSRELRIVDVQDNSDCEQNARYRPANRAFEWWPTVSALESGLVASVDTGDFDVRAGLITADAYLLKPFIEESSADTLSPHFRLLTSGLIDPGVSRWGQTPCRFLGQIWQRPVVRSSEAPEPWLRRVLERARRPKLIVAGLGRRFECLLDAQGAYVPSVGTWAVYHTADNAASLARLYEQWGRSDVSAWMQAELGANAMNGGSITLTRPFMKRLVATGLAARPAHPGPNHC
jgi:hypothetical protein